MSIVVNCQLQARMSVLSRIDTSSSLNRPQEQDLERPSGNRAPCSPKDIDEDPDDFWSPPALSDQVARDDTIIRVSSNIRMSLTGPSPALDQNSEEFKRQAKEIKRDLQRWSRYAGRHSRSKSKGSISLEKEFWQAKGQLEQEHELRRRVSVEEGKEFLLDFLHHHFEDHIGAITIKSTKTLEEIKMIGNEDLSTGVRLCRRLFNAPVISDQVGLLLWQELRQGDALNHNHETRTRRSGSHTMEIGVMRRDGMELLLDNSTLEYMAQKQGIICDGVLGQLGVRIHNHNCACRGMTTSAQAPAGSVPRGVTMEGVVVVAATTATQQEADSIPMEKRTLDGFLESIKRRTSKGAGYFASSLAMGYA
jgi:hypothetical protein